MIKFCNMSTKLKSQRRRNPRILTSLDHLRQAGKRLVFITLKMTKMIKKQRELINIRTKMTKSLRLK